MIVNTLMTILSFRLIRIESAQQRVAFSMVGIIFAWVLFILWHTDTKWMVIPRTIGQSGFSWLVLSGLFILFTGVVIHTFLDQEV